jgi:hypothetical protein
MKRAPQDQDGDIDRVLLQEETVLPSSGFAGSVMDAVRREAAAPSPIPFPWKWALPGMIVGGLAAMVVAFIVFPFIGQSSKAASSQLFPLTVPSMPSLFNGGLESAAIWTGLSLLLALISVRVSMRLGTSNI